jgi:hypothetical protein
VHVPSHVSDRWGFVNCEFSSELLVATLQSKALKQLKTALPNAVVDEQRDDDEVSIAPAPSESDAGKKSAVAELNGRALALPCMRR